MTTPSTITFCCVFKKMTARFPEISGHEIQQLAEKAVNKNTVKTTKTWIKVWKMWAESKGLKDDIVKYEAKQLDECLSRFFAEIRKSDGSDYEPDSLQSESKGYVSCSRQTPQTKRQQNFHSEGPRIC